MKLKSRFFLSATPLLAAAFGLFLAAPASAVQVSLELALVVDESGSVDANEWLLQRNGYAAAFQSAAVKDAIVNSANGIAVSYIQFADGHQTGINWMHLDTAADADLFAAAILALPRFGNAGTGVAGAIDYAYHQFGTETGGALTNGFESTRQIIDVSGDGANNRNLDGSVSPAPAANLTDLTTDAAIAAGIDRINGVVINPAGEAGLEAFYDSQVKDGSGAFTVVADDFGDFEKAIASKIEREIVSTPDSGGTLACMSISLLGLAGLHRKLKGRKQS